MTVVNHKNACLDTNDILPYIQGMKTQMIQIRVDPKWLASLDRWRREQALREGRDISRAEAIRQIVGKSLD